MEQWSEIRRRVLVDGVSRRQIIRETGMHWETLQKILAHSEPPGYRQRRPRPRKKLGAYLPKIELILQEDLVLPRKQRHTAKRIWERLQTEGFTGGYTIVKDAVRELTQRRQEVFVPLVHRPGEAQVDFGEALVLEQGGWRARLTSLLPAAAVVLGWRAVYASAGFGVRNFTCYIDPGYEPLLFLRNLAPRLNALLGGQLTGLPPEAALAMGAKWQMMLAIFFAGFSLACAVVFLPILRRDRLARFWTAVMLLALVPAATVVPLSKNLGFVAVGAFGLIASFLAHFAARQERAAMPGPLRAMAWCVAGGLVLAHIPGALVGRGVLGLASPFAPMAWRCFCGWEGPPEIGGRDVVALNDPSMIVLPFDRLYRGKPLPNSARVLVPGLTPFVVKRAGASTLILTAKGTDLFDCPDLGPIHVGYAVRACNDLLIGSRTWKTGERVTRKGFVAEVLALSPRGAPRAMAFRFDKPLESEEMVWLYLDWRRGVTVPFVPPQVGETVEIRGPRGWHRNSGVGSRR